jgi:hypothetical protein
MALHRPLRPHTTSASEKLKDAHSAAQPRLTMNGSPSAVWASSCAAWLGGVEEKACVSHLDNVQRAPLSRRGPHLHCGCAPCLSNQCGDGGGQGQGSGLGLHLVSERLPSREKLEANG